MLCDGWLHAGVHRQSSSDIVKDLLVHHLWPCAGKHGHHCANHLLVFLQHRPQLDWQQFGEALRSAQARLTFEAGRYGHMMVFKGGSLPVNFAYAAEISLKLFSATSLSDTHCLPTRQFHAHHHFEAGSIVTTSGNQLLKIIFSFL